MVIYLDEQKSTKQIENELGVFYYLEKYHMFTTIINGSEFGLSYIRVSFPCVPNADNISTYQINYYREIQKNWKRLYQEIEKKLNYAPAGQILDTIIIPDIQVREKFDYEANMNFEVLKNDFIDAYVVDMKIDKIVHNGKELKVK